ncbi:hypothetical protein LUZ63_008152 [Rhynchospora breviuscula]|uniref:VPS37 C-terminal domain-containing protein n=1 Tax=Rhynchospora breviuscula TaxID=2022672 RepID=A0A9Q0CT20_9POAL|nr:hypothetical protein LUZ63_008152 [Rhynchospora breviuscula]
MINICLNSTTKFTIGVSPFPSLAFDLSSFPFPHKVFLLVSCNSGLIEILPLILQEGHKVHPANMSWRIPFFAGSDQVQTPSSTHGVPTQSWYPPSTQSSAYSTSSSSELMSLSANTNSAGIVSQLKDKSVDELKKLLADKAAYKAFFNSLNEVRIQNHTYGDLRKETLQLAESNLEKEPSLVELKNQCNVIRTSELASAQEKFAELLRQRDGIVNSYSRSGLLDKLNEAAYKADEESELLLTKLQKEEVDIRTFVQSYKNLRTTHHKLTLLHLAAKTSVF